MDAGDEDPRHKGIKSVTSFNVCHHLVPNIKVNLQCSHKSTSNERKGI